MQTPCMHLSRNNETFLLTFVASENLQTTEFRAVSQRSMMCDMFNV